jgi:hypothetical protein
MMGVATALLITQLAGCAEDPPPARPAPPELTQAEKDAIAEEVRREMEEREAYAWEVARSLGAASDAELIALLHTCKGQVDALMRESNTGPFASFLVDEYSADVYQVMAMTGATPFAERVATFRRSLEMSNGSRYAPSLNSRFTVISTSDSFSGPQRKATNYDCELAPGLEIINVTSRPSRY